MHHVTTPQAPVELMDWVVKHLVALGEENPGLPLPHLRTVLTTTITNAYTLTHRRCQTAHHRTCSRTNLEGEPVFIVAEGSDTTEISYAVTRNPSRNPEIHGEIQKSIRNPEIQTEIQTPNRNPEILTEIHVSVRIRKTDVHVLVYLAYAQLRRRSTVL